MKRLLPVALFGTVFGFVLSRIGFSSWDEVHRMFTFDDLRLFLTFLSAVGLLLPVWALLRRVFGARLSARSIHRGSLVGGVLFGAGWALTGACPSIGFVQLGEGQLGALWTIGGMFLGNWLYSVLHERYFRWSQTTCADI